MTLMSSLLQIDVRKSLYSSEEFWKEMNRFVLCFNFKNLFPSPTKGILFLHLLDTYWPSLKWVAFDVYGWHAVLEHFYFFSLLNTTKTLQAVSATHLPQRPMPGLAPECLSNHKMSRQVWWQASKERCSLPAANHRLAEDLPGQGVAAQWHCVWHQHWPGGRPARYKNKIKLGKKTQSS